MGIWGHPKGVNISDVGLNKVLISFEDSIKGFRLWRGGPWNIRGYLLNMHPWRGDKSALDVDHKRMELWIQMHGVPRSCMSQKNVEKTSSAFGDVLEVEDPWREKTLQRTFLRAKVQLNIVEMPDESDNIQRKVKKYRAKPGITYIVEMPDESEEDGEEGQNLLQLQTNQQRGMELALYMENALNLKRKWQQEEQNQKEDIKIINSAKIEETNSLKKRNESEYDKAEEAGLMMPHKEP
ncbi:hypothetical protein PIB30_059899 [Stylosanthes scabra]|uniref:DUF4283 domain-containing protein n=1 Tax=Stylosanthes scabra TaxID=79078 RepID=A0ABU6YKQ3_9FABA|nr:hypothetical protein [Stylosanthes scabra]